MHERRQKGLHQQGITLRRLPLLLALGIAGALAVVRAVDLVPETAKQDVSNALRRPFSPHFDLPPDAIKAAAQADVVGEYKRRGYALECAGNLRPEERISKEDDYVCWSLIKAAYDNVPANRVVFFFGKGELQHVKVDFPEKAFTALQDYLSRRLVHAVRLDERKPNRFGTDIYGKPLMVWLTREGLVVTSSAPTPGHPMTLLWTSKQVEMRRICTEWASRREAALAKSGAVVPEPIKEMLRRYSPPLLWPDTTCESPNL